VSTVVARKQLEPPPVNTPLVVIDEEVDFSANLTWSVWLNLLFERTRNSIDIVQDLSADTAIDDSMEGDLLLCFGTHTQTLPSPIDRRGYVFRFFNADTGVITIDGIINGNPAGYQLVNPYQYVTITGDGTGWIVTGNN
jgi:hypothetical protein